MLKPICPNCRKQLTGDEDLWSWQDKPYLAFCSIACHSSYNNSVLVAGDNSCSYELLHYRLDRVNRYNPITRLIHGGAQGFDMLADKWAEEHNVPVLICPLDTYKHGPNAEHMRNVEMLKERPKLVLIFASSKSVSELANDAVNAGLKVVFV